MGAIGGLTSLAGGASGTGFAPPASANIQQVANTGQSAQLYNQSQAAMGQQQQLLNALQGAGGIQNQNTALQGLQNTANQYQQVASGQGPNPALAQLNQTTGQNIAAQGALMAGQRGASQNVGLMARQAAMQGANTQQQAVGQAATLGAQQQLGALSGLSSTQQAAGNLASQQAANQIAQTNQNVGSAQNMYNNVAGAIGAQNTANVAMQSNVNNNNAALAQAQMQNQGNLLGGLGNAAGVGLGLLTGGASPAIGGLASQIGNVQLPSMSGTGPLGLAHGGVAAKSAIGRHLMSKGGMVNVMVSPGEKILSPGAAKNVARGGALQAKTVPGSAKVSGDSLKNDTVPMKLPAGSVVVPRSKANGDPAGFVQAVLAKKRGKK